MNKKDIWYEEDSDERDIRLFGRVLHKPSVCGSLLCPTCRELRNLDKGDYSDSDIPPKPDTCPMSDEGYKGYATNYPWHLIPEDSDIDAFIAEVRDLCERYIGGPSDELLNFNWCKAYLSGADPVKVLESLL